MPKIVMVFLTTYVQCAEAGLIDESLEEVKAASVLNEGWLS